MIIVFLDSIQRTVVATLERTTETELHVTRPAILNVAPTNEKKLQVQLYPLIFREFLNDRDSFPVWKYPLSSIVVAENIVLEANLVAQYNEMFKTTVKVQGNPTIRLFDADEPVKN
jgi:hypothetical protein